MSDRTRCYVCKLYVQPWREGLHNICNRCERELLEQDLAHGWPQWLKSDAEVEADWHAWNAHHALRQASEAGRGPKLTDQEWDQMTEGLWPA